MTARHLRNLRRLAQARPYSEMLAARTRELLDTVTWEGPVLDGMSAAEASAALERFGRSMSHDWTYTPGDTTETGTGSPGAGLSLENGGSEGSVGLSGDSGDVGGENDSQQAIADPVKVNVIGTAAENECDTCSGPMSRQTVDMVCQSCGRDFLSRTALDWQAEVAEAVEQARAEEREAIAGWLDGLDPQVDLGHVSVLKVHHELAHLIRLGLHLEADRG